MPNTAEYAPGWPGIPARWTSSAKSGVGVALTFSSRVWFTLSHGILNEVYWPREDQACIRDMGLVVTDGREYFSQEKRHAEPRIQYLANGVPAFRLINTSFDQRYRIEKEILTDPARDVVLQQTRFVALQGALSDYRLYVLLAPHIGNQGAGNTAWVGDYKGTPMLFASRGERALALACSVPWRARSAGFVGASDGWHDLLQHKRLTWAYLRAENGNTALAGEIDLDAGAGVCTLALGFGATPEEAALRASLSLFDGFDVARDAYVSGWEAWQRTLTRIPDSAGPSQPAAPGQTRMQDLYRVSAAVLHTHASKTVPGGVLASLSIPWGFASGDGDLGGYHLVWPRDLVEAAGGALAMGAFDGLHRVLHYLRLTQELDGHWPQNMWLDGRAYWNGVQLDETAFPILLVDLVRRADVLAQGDLERLWPMVRKAAGFLVQNGPVTQQDRWEEDGGYSPFTLAVEIAALLAAADLAELNGEGAVAPYLRDTADIWNANIERWTYAEDTDLSRRLGIRGYYVRIAPPEAADAASPLEGFVPIKNRPRGSSALPATELVSPDALALVRFGLRAADDPRILDTVRAIDALLRVETPFGPAWHRYNGDGYGEHEDGAPFDGTGVGRAWPLLTGERAHYELAAGHRTVAEDLLRTMECFANESGLLPEQIWDAPDIPDRELFFGRPSGAAMPLVWAHAEYLKLRRSLEDGRVFDAPPQPQARYGGSAAAPAPAVTVWRFNHKTRSVVRETTLRIETLAAATVHWTHDGWQTTTDTPTGDTGLGVYVADLPTAELGPGTEIRFTFFWAEAARWEGVDFIATVT